MNTRTPATVILLVIMLLSGSASAQTPTSNPIYTSDLTGAVIDIGDTDSADVANEDPFTYEEPYGDQEFFYLEYRGIAVNFLFETGERPPQEIATEFQGYDAEIYWKFAVMNEEYSAESGWYLEEHLYLVNFKEYTYVELWNDAFDDSISYGVVIYSNGAGIMDVINWLQNDVTVDGEPALRMPDYSQIDSMVAAAADVPTVATTTYDLTLEENREFGLVSENEWVSPTSGDRMEWTNKWFVPYGTPRAVRIYDDGWEAVTIMTPDMNGLTQLNLPHGAADLITMEDWVDRWLSALWQASIGDYQILDSTVFTTDTSATVILEGTAVYGEPFVMILTAHVLDDGSVISTRIVSAPEASVATLELTQSDVLLNGEPLIFPFTIPELETTLAD